MVWWLEDPSGLVVGGHQWFGGWRTLVVWWLEDPSGLVVGGP